MTREVATNVKEHNDGPLPGCNGWTVFLCQGKQFPFPHPFEKMAEIQNMENETLRSCFWTSKRRQYGVIMIVNLAAFLQGASTRTSAISIPRMPTNESTIDDASWPFDFAISDQDAYWIS